MSRQRLQRALVLLLACAAAPGAGACDDLPELRGNECGNTLVEDWEACDTFGRDGSASGKATACGQPGTPAECLYVHDEDHDCPRGYGAGVDGVCRRPTWEFAQAPVATLTSSGLDAHVADFDGDGVDDLFLSRPLAPEAHVHYFAPGGAHRESVALSTPIALLPSAQGDLTGDGRPEVVVPDLSGLLVLRNETGPRFSPRGYAPLPAPEPSRPFAIPASAYADEDSIYTLTGFHTEGWLADSAGALELQFAADPSLNAARIEGYTLADVVAVALGDFIPEAVLGVPLPNDEIAIGLSGSSAAQDRVLLIEPHANEDARQVYELDHFGAAGRRLIAGPFTLKRKDGSAVIGHAESDAGGQMYVRVSRFDGAALTLDAAEYAMFRVDELPASDAEFAARLPVAMGAYELGFDLPVVVSSDALRVGFPLLCGPNPLTQGCLNVASGNTSFAPWTTAIVDVPQGIVFAGSSEATGLDVLRIDADGTHVNPSRVVTERPTRQLVAGDYDGDGATDALILSRSSPEPSCEDDSELTILWGELAGHPSELTPLGELAGSFEAVAGRLIRIPEFDGIDDFGVMTACSDEGAPQRAGVFIGNAARQPKCGYPLLDQVPPFGDETGELANQGLVPVAVGALEPAAEGAEPTASILALTFLDGALQLRALDAGPDADIVGTRFFPILDGLDETQVVGAETTGAITTADFDGDGLLDVLLWAVELSEDEGGTRTAVPGFYLGLRRGQGFEFSAHVAAADAWGPYQFVRQPPASPYAIFSSWDTNVDAVDVDADGRLDIVGRVNDGERNELFVLFQQADRSFSPGPLPLPEGVIPFTFFASNPEAPRLAVATNEGPYLCAAGVCEPALDAPREGAFATALGDFDGDGVADLAVFGLSEAQIFHGVSVEERAREASQ